jgi:type IV pilus assembly protein PilY1
MTSLYQNKIFSKIIQVCSMVAFTLSVTAVNAALTDLGNAPLVSATTGDVLPNLMYVLDNSGSMGWDYMPDYVNDNNKCKNSSGNFTAACAYADPPYMTNFFNGIYYDPATRYLPGLNADGSQKISMSSANSAGWTVVPNDAYGIQSTTNASLVPNPSLSAGYPDVVWCNSSLPSASNANLSNPAYCQHNNQYTYPNSIYSTGYTLRGYPFYYNVAAGLYCTDSGMADCIPASAPSGTHTFPAKLRWCKDATHANGTCQSKYLETTPTYTFADWGVTGASATGSIQINAQSPANSPASATPGSMSISNITVNGTRIIPTTPAPPLTITDTTVAGNRNTLAANIVTAINAMTGTTNYSATSSGDIVTITNTVYGTFSGIIAVTDRKSVV